MYVLPGVASGSFTQELVKVWIWVQAGNRSQSPVVPGQGQRPLPAKSLVLVLTDVT